MFCGKIQVSHEVYLLSLRHMNIRLSLSGDLGLVELPHSAGRLFQQYLVDAYSKVESQRLEWVLRNQNKLRVESLSGLMDYLSSANDVSSAASLANGPTALNDATPRIENPRLTDSAASASDPQSRPASLIGKPVILPATFGGSPRALHQSYLDSMCLVARFGKPDFLITITANPAWKEVTANLRPGETASDRPDLVARVFHSKLKALLQLLTKDGFLGHAVAWTWVVEFQKRGLPHAHILLIVRAEDKPTTPEHIDALVSAEIPDSVSHPHLFRLVETHMVHGPCGHLNPACPCMQDGICTKNYPKSFVPETRVKEGGYPQYRRRETSPLRTVKNGLLDTRSIVPHNILLLETFECHINVEVCTSIRAVKYLYKYTYKGPDRACLERSIDEVAQFVDSRYCGAPEAVWRLLAFPLQGRSHHVERLPVHLPLSKNVTFEVGSEADAVSSALLRRSKLEAWFTLNSNAAKLDARTASLVRSLRYPDIPRYFLWDTKSCSWIKRQRTSKESVSH